LPRPAAFLRPLLLYLVIVLILAVAFSLACGSGETGDQQGKTGSGTPLVTPPPANADAIRSVDFTKVSEVQTRLSQLGGGTKLMPSEILYADVTGDRREEAMVPINSGGSLGNVSYLVFTMSNDKPSLILTRSLERSNAGGLRMVYEDGRLSEWSGEYGDEDARCCPSKVRKTFFRWDGARLQVDREEVVANPAGQQNKN
jgi:hypothetical protein